MSAALKPTYTPQEYLDFERRSELKHEYYRGQIYQMDGASFNHNRIVANLIAVTHSRLSNSPCSVLPSDMRVKCPSGLYTYPDAVVVCGEVDLEDGYRDTLLNPTVLFEVLSPSTERYDRGTRSDHCRGISSLMEYVLITQDRPRVEHYVRTEDEESWSFRTHHELDQTLTLVTGDVSIPLSDLYDNIVFAEASAELRSDNA